MAMKIDETCINCGNCEPDCPNTAISQGDSYYVIAVDKCTECVGAFDAPKCVEVCPVEGCITIDAALNESKEVLQARYQQLHP
jgi:ferredoxin